MSDESKRVDCLSLPVSTYRAGYLYRTETEPLRNQQGYLRVCEVQIPSETEFRASNEPLLFDDDVDMFERVADRDTSRVEARTFLIERSRGRRRSRIVGREGEAWQRVGNR